MGSGADGNAAPGQLAEKDAKYHTTIKAVERFPLKLRTAMLCTNECGGFRGACFLELNLCCEAVEACFSGGVLRILPVTI